MSPILRLLALISSIVDHHLRHHLAAALRHRRCRRGQLVGLRRRVRALAHRARQLHDRAGRLLQVRRRVLGALAEVVVAVGDLLGRQADAAAGRLHGLQALAQLAAHVAQGAQQVTDLVVAVAAGLRGQVAAGHFARQLDGA
jgi:hypothetical protein